MAQSRPEAVRELSKEMEELERVKSVTHVGKCSITFETGDKALSISVLDKMLSDRWKISDVVVMDGAFTSIHIKESKV